MFFKQLFYYLIFPGFLFASVVGLLAGWVDRKVSARIQYRVGPPWYQNFVDIIKLFGKEIITPPGRAFTFLFAPLMGIVSSTIVASFLGLVLLNSQSIFFADLIIVIYLLTVPAISLIIGASASANPLASIGVSREIKMVLGYELPFILSLAIVIIKAGSLRLADIINYQLLNGSLALSWSGAIGLIVAFLCIQAKLGFVPFDAPEADQEIMCGTLIEYSGLPLAIFRLTRFILLYTLPLFLIIIFLSGDIKLTSLGIKFLLILVAIILVKNTNPRLRIDQAIRFFWKILTPLAVLGVILAFLGK
jgi:NADH-quinone oxidoreductase subunit H